MKLTDRQAPQCAGVVVKVEAPSSDINGYQSGWEDLGMNTRHQVVGTVQSVAGHLHYTPHDSEVEDLVDAIGRGNFPVEEIVPAGGRPFVRPGDKVYFSAAAHADASRVVGDGLLSIPHWMVFCRVDGERMVAAPGYCLVEPIEQQESVGMLTVGNQYWIGGRVISMGAPAKYHHDPEAHKFADLLPILDGRVVSFKRNRGINLDQEWMLGKKILVIQTKDIVAYE